MGKGPNVNGQQIDELGNYWPCVITEDDVTYPSVEHYFQSKKCQDEPERTHLLSLSSAACARFGRRVKLVDNWESIKFDVMKQGMRLKFDQHPTLKALLLATYPNRLFFCEKDEGEQDTWDEYNERILTQLRKEYLQIVN